MFDSNALLHASSLNPHRGNPDDQCNHIVGTKHTAGCYCSCETAKAIMSSLEIRRFTKNVGDELSVVNQFTEKRNFYCSYIVKEALK